MAGGRWSGGEAGGREARGREARGRGSWSAAETAPERRELGPTAAARRGRPPGGRWSGARGGEPGERSGRWEGSLTTALEGCTTRACSSPSGICPASSRAAVPGWLGGGSKGCRRRRVSCSPWVAGVVLLWNLSFSLWHVVLGVVPPNGGMDGRRAGGGARGGVTSCPLISLDGPPGHGGRGSRYPGVRAGELLGCPRGVLLGRPLVPSNDLLLRRPRPTYG